MAEAALGLLLRDRERCALVISPDGELAVAVRDLLPRSVAIVRDARPGEEDRAVAACLPWPWLLVGNVADLGEPARRRLHAAPVIVLWLGPMPGDLPLHARGFQRYQDLAVALRDVASHDIAGMHLAPGLGVMMPSGACARTAALEALVSQHPRGFALPSRRFRAAGRALRDHGVDSVHVRTLDGGVTLAS